MDYYLWVARPLSLAQSAFVPAFGGLPGGLYVWEERK